MKKGEKMTQEQKDKIGKANKGKGAPLGHMAGHIVSAETRAKISAANKGRPVWNKGMKLPSRPMTEEVKKKLSVALRGNTNGSGNKGRVYSAETRKRMSEAQIGRPPMTQAARQKISDANSGKLPANLGYVGKYMNVKRGWFGINGKQMFFRSRWEANYALYLDFLVKQGIILKWEYEPFVFVFHKIQFGTRSYCPDFKVYNLDGSSYYDEVKGYMDDKSKTKIKRMAKYYPEITLNIIDGKEYRALEKKLGGILKFF